ncbi:MAG TPA: prepilin-type N-terminal cleavage/methylation domain-containing protein [Steroidobacteraceae bacterium]|nr:prepilin-type N-terminal cleavage/methylation domain-containing protein [Steroidobacteraceae bacterium]
MESRELIPGGPAGAAVRIRGFRFAAQRGFTLLEVMIVVVIIGILVVGAILSLGSTGKDSGLEQERDRLSALVAYGRERGAMLTLEYGIRCGQHGYRFVFYDNRLMRWAPETLDDTLHPRKLPSGLRLDLTIEGHPIVLADNALKVNPIAATPPGGTVSPLGSSSGIGAITGTAGLGALSSSGGLSGGLGSGFTGLGGSSSGAGSSSSGGLSGSGTGGGLNNQPDNDMPQIMLFSNGDTNSFVLTMVREGVNRSVTLQSSDDGSVKVGDIIEPKQ